MLDEYPDLIVIFYTSHTHRNCCGNFSRTIIIFVVFFFSLEVLFDARISNVILNDLKKKLYEKKTKPFPLKLDQSEFETKANEINSRQFCIRKITETHAHRVR